MNPGALRVTGRHREDVIGADACAIFHQPDTGGEGCRGVCTPVRALASGERFRSEHPRLRRADGSTFPARIIATPFEEGGARRGSVVVFSDITEQRQAQEAMEAARRAAEETNLRFWFEVPVGVAHDAALALIGTCEGSPEDIRYV